MQILLSLFALLSVCEFSESYGIAPHEVTPLALVKSPYFTQRYHTYYVSGERSNGVYNQCMPSRPCGQTPVLPGIPSRPPLQPRPQNCRKIYSVMRRQVTWRTAVEECKKIGQRLVSVHNKYEWEQVVRTIALSGAPMNFWTSGSNLGHTHYMWTSTWQPFSFTNWDDGEPNNFLGNQNCAFIKSNTLKWDDWDCNGLHYFICETYVGIC